MEEEEQYKELGSDESQSPKVFLQDVDPQSRQSKSQTKSERKFKNLGNG